MARLMHALGLGKRGTLLVVQAAALVLTALLVTGSCRARGDTETSDLAPSSQTVIVGRASDAISLDPARVTDNESVEICGQIYESLLHYQAGASAVQPGLARSWTVSEDGRVWEFELREGVEFHDGTPLNADAVVFSFLRQLDPEHPFHQPDSSGSDFAWRAAYKNIETVEALGEHRVRIVIDRKFAPFASNLAMFPVAIVSPSAVETWGPEFHRHPVGTGPFSFSTWDEEKGRIVLERYEKYWGTKPKLERLIFTAISDARQRLVALESGSVQVAYSILPDEQQFVSLHPQLRLHRAAANNVAYLAINTQRPPFTDVRVRRALNHAINKEPIVKLAYQGMAIPAQGALPPGQWGFTPSSFRYSFDTERARAMLAEVIEEGVLDPAMEIKFYVPTTPRPYLPDPLMVAQIIKANLEAVGLRVRVVEQDFASHLSTLRAGEHDISLMGWVGDNGDPDNYLYVLFDQDNARKGTARNLSFLRDSLVHELLLDAQKADTREERTEIYRQAQLRIGELAPWVPLVHSQVSVVASTEVKGLALGPTAQIVFKKVERR